MATLPDRKWTLSYAEPTPLLDEIIEQLGVWFHLEVHFKLMYLLHDMKKTILIQLMLDKSSPEFLNETMCDKNINEMRHLEGKCSRTDDSRVAVT